DDDVAVTGKPEGASGGAVQALPVDCPEFCVPVLPDPGGVGVGCDATAGGGAGAADPWPNCHVQEAVACVPAGSINPRLPLTRGVLDPFATRGSPGFGRDTSTTGKAHSNASAEIVPGLCGFPSMVSC